MRKLLLAGVAVVALTGPARAIPVECINCSTPFSDEVMQAAHEVWEGAQWLRALEQQIMQVKYEIMSWVEFVKTNAMLPFRLFNDVTGSVREVQYLVQEASMIGPQAKFMIDHLGGGFGGGSLEDIPFALAQEDRALSWAMQRMGMSMQRSQSMSADYSAKLAELQAQDVSGPTQAAQVMAQIAATRGQQEAAEAATRDASMQAMATAELRRAHREVMLEQKVAQNQRAAISASCGQLTVIQPQICQSQPSTTSTTQIASAQ